MKTHLQKVQDVQLADEHPDDQISNGAAVVDSAPSRTSTWFLWIFTGGLVLVIAIAAVFGTQFLSSARPVSEALPFGPNWAADYGSTHKAAVDLSTGLPFGPGWAANYGTESSYALPFGPEIAATYNNPIRTLPFGPELAANYGNHGKMKLPFGPGYAATYGVAPR